MKSVLISIKPKYCELIANGKKTIEVRKRRPKIETPFKCYIYQTKAKQVEHCDGCDITYYGCGEVIGEFVCDRIEPLTENDLLYEGHYVEEKTRVSQKELLKYKGKNDFLYGWNISELKIYEKPKELIEFRYPCPDKNYDTCYGCKYFYHDETEMCCKKEAVRPPQSWCYVEE